MSDFLPHELVPASIKNLKRMELVLTLVSNYFEFGEKKTLADAQERLTELKERVVPQGFWGEKHKPDESLLLATLTVQELQTDGYIPVAFAWFNIIIEALTNPETPIEKASNWGPEKTRQALNEIRHFLGLLS